MIWFIPNSPFCISICHNNFTVFHCSPKELHFRRYSKPDHVSTIVPSGMNKDATHHVMLRIMTWILCECYGAFDLSTIDRHASGFMSKIYRLRHLGYPMPPPIMLECKSLLLMYAEVSLVQLCMFSFWACFVNQ
jgi:hypothetical protein